MIFDNPDKSWEKLGKTDPYYGVITVDKFRAGKLDEANRLEFFSQGRSHMARILSCAESATHRIARRRGLDFGCGVGRLVLPLATDAGFSEVVGIDISPSMLAEAARNASLAQVNNVRFVLGDDRLSQLEGTFDFIHSCIVLQHIPIRRGLEIIGGLLGRLSPGGVAALQMPFSRKVSWARHVANQARVHVRPLHILANLIQGRPLQEPPMQMNLYNLNSVLQITHDRGIRRVTIDLASDGGNLGAYLFVQKNR